MTLLFLGNIKGWEWLIIIAAILMLFKVNKIPQLMRSMGKAVHGFRQGLEDAKKEISKPIEKDLDNTSDDADRQSGKKD